MKERLAIILKHLRYDVDVKADEGAEIYTNVCIGEMENREVNTSLEYPSKGNPQTSNSHPVFKYRYTRVPIKIAFQDNSAADERYGGSGDTAILEGELIKADTVSNTVVIFMHPSGIQNLLPMPNAMARTGLHVVTCTSRYPNNDSCLIMEKVLIDLNACIEHMKTHFGYKKIVLAGWSGGGALSSFYQAQAENPTITHTPAGDKIDLSNLTKADALLILAAHTSRARIFTEWIDPAVLDENDPGKRDPYLDIFDPKNPNQPPYSKEFISHYRDSQIRRNRRITQWVKEQLDLINKDQMEIKGGWKQSRRDLPFTVFCTQADIRRLDPSIEPNGREKTSFRALAAENHSPVGLARFTTLRSWLSQWSYDESHADGPGSLQKVSVPVLVMSNEADHLVPGSHPLAMYNAVPHSNKTFYEVKGATHYYFGQSEKLAEATKFITEWLKSQGFDV